MNIALTPPRPNRNVRVVLSTTTLQSFMSVSKATAMAVAELGIAIFFVAGVARSFVGDGAAWFVLAACVVGVFVRTIEIEVWSFFIPGGVIGRTECAFGSRVANIATAAILTERLLFVALACVLCGQYIVSVAGGWMAQWSVTAWLTIQELVTVGAVILIGLLWVRARLGLQVTSNAAARAVWVAVCLILLVILFGITTLIQLRVPALAESLLPVRRNDASALRTVLGLFAGFALVLP